PGDVTISRSSTGCTCSSRSSFAVPSIVWTTSCVDVSRLSPSRIPASIIASASSAKYAGPEPETAVTASMYRSGTRATAPRCDSTSSATARCSSPACAPAVPLFELAHPLLAATCDDDLVRRAPVGAQQPREQRLADLPRAEDRDLPAHTSSLGAERFAIRRQRRLVAEDEPRQLDVWMGTHCILRRVDRPRGGKLDGIAVRAGRRCRECPPPVARGGRQRARPSMRPRA